MKKTALIVWTIIVSLLLAFFVYRACGFKRDNPYLDMRLPGRVLKSSLLDSVLAEHGLVFALFGIEDCDLCKFAYAKIENDYPSYPKLYFNIKEHENNLLASQSLLISGFPTLVLLDESKNILAFCNNCFENNSKIDSVLLAKECGEVRFVDLLQTDCFSDKNAYLETVNVALKATLNYIDCDYEGMKSKAYQSLQHGSYFFNNYLLCQYYKHNLNADSVSYFRQKALSFNRHHDIQAAVYQDKIENLTNEN